MNQGEIDANIAERLREARRELGVTISECAEILGVSETQTKKYFRGVTRLSAGKLLVLARYLNVSLDDFDIGVRPAMEAVRAPLDNMEMRAALANLDGASRRAILHIVKGLAEESDVSGIGTD